MNEMTVNTMAPVRGTAAPRSAVVIGSGFGGLALAIRLQSAGVKTTIVEARDKPLFLSPPELREGGLSEIAQAVEEEVVPSAGGDISVPAHHG